MPVRVIKRGAKYRIIDVATGKLTKRKGGKSVDGRGHATRAKAKLQAAAINLSLKKKK